MDARKKFDTDYYVISSSFRLLDFNQNVRDRYKGVERGDLCYKATMKRSTPCPHCPIAGNTDKNAPIYYDPFYRDWIQAVFSNVGDGIYAVTCKRADGDAKDLFQRLKNTELSGLPDPSDHCNSENMGIIGGYCEAGFPLYYVNDNMIRMLGYDSREDFEKGIRGMVSNTIHPDDMNQVIMDLGNEFYPGKSYETTYRMPRKDGSWFWTIDRGEVIETSDGRLAIISACIDVTKAREEQEMIQRENDASASRERILSDIISGLYSYNATVNLDTGKYSLTVGKGMEDYILQFSKTDDFSEACSILLSNVLPEYIDELNRQFSLEALRSRRNHRGHIGQMEYRGVTKDGIGWFEVNAFMGVDKNGVPTASVFGRDVTEQHLAAERRERELRAIASREQLLSDITKMLYGYNLTVNVRTGKYTLIEGSGMKHAVDFLRSSDDYEAAYRQFWLNTSEKQRPIVEEMLSLKRYRKNPEKPGIVRTEVFLEHLPPLEPQWHEMNVISSVDQNGEPILNILARDVTEAHEKIDTKTQLKIAQASSEAKTAFLFNMSHDIRTPMNAIIGFTELLKDHLDDKEKAKGYIQKIETANDFLLSLINNVLEMARIESGKITLDETPNNIYEFSSSLFALLGPQIREKNIRLNKTIEIEHEVAMIDNTKLREIHLNILSNAVKYTPSGGSISFSIKELPSQQNGIVRYQTIVEDNGIGMSEGFVPHIFDDFTRERTSTESKVVGTGLGMPIVKKLVDLMQGTIEVQSQMGKGTKITVVLPHRLVGSAEEDEEKSTESTVDISIFQGKRILLAEDNELNAEIAMTILEEEGFTVEWAEDGVIAVDMVEKKGCGYYDLVLMDIQMPNMDGYKATRVIRALPDKKKSSLPIVAMTANAFEEDKNKALSIGMDAHITKPMQISVLRSVLSSVLKSRK